MAASTRPTAALLGVNAARRRQVGRRFRVDSSSGTVGLPKLLWCHCCIRRALSVALRNTVAAADQQCPARRDADGGVHSPHSGTAWSQRGEASAGGAPFPR